MGFRPSYNVNRQYCNEKWIVSDSAVNVIRNILLYFVFSFYVL